MRAIFWILLLIASLAGVATSWAVVVISGAAAAASAPKSQQPRRLPNEFYTGIWMRFKREAETLAPETTTETNSATKAAGSTTISSMDVSTTSSASLEASSGSTEHSAASTTVSSASVGTTISAARTTTKAALDEAVKTSVSQLEATTPLSLTSTTLALETSGATTSNSAETTKSAAESSTTPISAASTAVSPAEGITAADAELNAVTTAKTSEEGSATTPSSGSTSVSSVSVSSTAMPNGETTVKSAEATTAALDISGSTKPIEAITVPSASAEIHSTIEGSVQTTVASSSGTTDTLISTTSPSPGAEPVQRAEAEANTTAATETTSVSPNAEAATTSSSEITTVAGPSNSSKSSETTTPASMSSSEPPVATTTAFAATESTPETKAENISPKPTEEMIAVTTTSSTRVESSTSAAEGTTIPSATSENSSIAADQTTTSSENLGTTSAAATTKSETATTTPIPSELAAGSSSTVASVTTTGSEATTSKPEATTISGSEMITTTLPASEGSATTVGNEATTLPASTPSNGTSEPTTSNSEAVTTMHAAATIPTLTTVLITTQPPTTTTAKPKPPSTEAPKPKEKPKEKPDDNEEEELEKLNQTPAPPSITNDATAVISVDNGEFTGSVIKTQFGVVHAFFGIPYAKPPLDELRFEKPQPPEPVWKGTATELKPNCMQAQSVMTPSGEMSEDCLYLNLMKPAHPSCDRKGYPALVYLYGGGFEYGGSAPYITPYMAEHYVSKGIVYMVLNYRIGVFGFATDKTEDLPGNLGLWDIRMALLWLRNNAEALEVDPERITLWGYSAGGAAAGQLAVSPYTRDLFARTIQMSGPMAASFSYGDKVVESTKRTARNLGCDPNKIKECLKAETTERIQKAYASAVCSATIMINWQPTFDNDFFTADPAEMLKDAPPKPAFYSTSYNEGLIFTIFGVLDALESAQLSEPERAEFDETKFHDYVERMVVPQSALGNETSATLADKITQFYLTDHLPRNITDRHEQILYQYGMLLHDLFFTMPLATEIKQRQDNGANVYLLKTLRMDWIDKTFPNVPVRDTTHTYEYGYLFGVTGGGPMEFTKEDRTFRDWLIKTIVFFVENGEPSRSNYFKKSKIFPYTFFRYRDTGSMEWDFVDKKTVKFWNEINNGTDFDIIRQIDHRSLSSRVV